MNDVPAVGGGRPAPPTPCCSTSARTTSGPRATPPTARHVPMSQLTGRLDEVPAADPLYVICRSGSRSARVVAFLSAAGRPGGERGGRHAGVGRRRTADGRRARGRHPGRHLRCGAARWMHCPRCGRAGRGQRPSARTAGATSPRSPGSPPRPRSTVPPPAAASGPLRRAAALPVHPALGLPGAAVDAARPTEPPRRATRSPPPAPRSAASCPRSGPPPRWRRVAAGAELWRYVLLLASRSDALPAGAGRGVGRAGDVGGARSRRSSRFSPGVLLVVWSVRASRAAGELAGGGARPVGAGDRRGLGGARGQPVGARARCSPRSSTPRWTDRPGSGRGRRGCSARGGCCGWPNLAGRRGRRAVVVAHGVQAQADGVVLHAVLDLLAAVTAGVTAVLAVRLTRLLTPQPRRAPRGPRRRPLSPR